MPRSYNFTEQELNVILSYLETNKELVTKEFSGNIKSVQDQKKAWDVLTELVNSVGFGSRKTDAVKQKWCDLKYKTKKKAAEIKNYTSKTGGGPQCEKTLSSTEERIIKLIGPTCVQGITPQIFDTSYHKETENEVQPVSLLPDFTTPSRNDALDIGATSDESTPSSSQKVDNGTTNERTTPSSSWYLKKNGYEKSSIRRTRKRRYEEVESEVENIVDTQGKICQTLQEMKLLLQQQNQLMEESISLTKQLVEAQNVQTIILSKIGNVQLEYNE